MDIKNDVVAISLSDDIHHKCDAQKKTSERSLEEKNFE